MPGLQVPLQLQSLFRNLLGLSAGLFLALVGVLQLLDGGLQLGHLQKQ